MPPEVALLPKRNGHEVLAAMREEPELRRIAVAVLTTSGAEADVVKTYDLGANCWLGTVRLPRS